MSLLIDRACSSIADSGFAVLPAVFTAAECEVIAGSLGQALAACADDATALRRANGVIYGARNLLAVYPPARTLWQRQPLLDLLAAVLGSGYGLVRGLYFDKPPDGNWSLPWHQDLTIAVRDHSLPSGRFRHRTVKAGVPHVEAPDEVLKQKLTLRVHLDDATEENGPLRVLPGTHIGRAAAPLQQPITVLAAAGDVLAMRPLLSHSSGPAQAGSARHRRIIHLEFACSAPLPDDYHWHQFISGTAQREFSSAG